MSIQFSPIVASQPAGDGNFSVQAIEVHDLGEWASPVRVLHQFRVTGRPFPPHPHAGFSAVTYVLEDSRGSLRSRDSLGNDLVTGPGGVVWTEAGSGILHEEVPAEIDQELHAVQIFVNLSTKNKLVTPRMLRLEGNKIPEWRNEAGDRVRVVVGSWAGILSPLVPSDPFNLFDVHLQGGISFRLPDANNAVVYVLSGHVLVQSGDQAKTITNERAIALHGSGRVSIQTIRQAHILILLGPEIREPVVEYGGFIMTDHSQIEACITRYSTGQMGHLEPISEIERGQRANGPAVLRDTASP